MTIEITGRHIQIPERERVRAEKRITRLKRHTGRIDEARIILTGEKHRVAVEAIVSSGRQTWKAHEETDDISSCITAALDKIEAQAEKDRARRKARKGRASTRSLASEEEVGRSSRQRRPTPTPEKRIVRSARVPVKPMSAEEAAIELDESRSDFIVFRDALSERVAVLYKRRDGDFGLIAPEW
jgi:putative sigma-54 modulation protein